jgi:hypothetical protein
VQLCARHVSPGRVCFLRFDDRLVSVSTGNLPFGGGHLAVGVSGTAVPAAGHTVLAVRVAALPGGLPADAGLRQQLPESRTVFPVAVPASFGHLPACLRQLPSRVVTGIQLGSSLLGGGLVPQLGVP